LARRICIEITYDGAADRRRLRFALLDCFQAKVLFRRTGRRSSSSSSGNGRAGDADGNRVVAGHARGGVAQGAAFEERSIVGQCSAAGSQQGEHEDGQGQGFHRGPSYQWSRAPV
jgi:hypothetical protein